MKCEIHNEFNRSEFAEILIISIANLSVKVLSIYVAYACRLNCFHFRQKILGLVIRPIDNWRQATDRDGGLGVVGKR